MDASLADSIGKIIPLKFCPLANSAMEIPPRIDLNFPDKPNSPAIRNRLMRSAFSCFVDARRHRATGKSNALPSFFRSAGARLIVTLVLVRLNPLVVIQGFFHRSIWKTNQKDLRVSALTTISFYRNWYS